MNCDGADFCDYEYIAGKGWRYAPLPPTLAEIELEEARADARYERLRELRADEQQEDVR